MRWTDDDEPRGYTVYSDEADRRFLRGLSRRPKPSRVALAIGWLWRAGPDILAAVLFVLVLFALMLLLALIAPAAARAYPPVM